MYQFKMTQRGQEAAGEIILMSLAWDLVSENL